MLQHMEQTTLLGFGPTLRHSQSQGFIPYVTGALGWRSLARGP